MDCAILSSHRKVPPHGLAGGEAGRVGTTHVRRLDGRIDELAGCDQTVLKPGEAVIVTTPTGGGYDTYSRVLARHIMTQLELRRRSHELTRAKKDRERIGSDLTKALADLAAARRQLKRCQALRKGSATLRPVPADW